MLADDERLEVRRNSEWLDMKMEDLFRLVRTVTIARLLERDDFAKRMAAAEPISLLEFLYPVLQGYDSVAVRADVELGGTDQTFNLHMGRALQTTHGQPPQIVLTMPLLNGLDGDAQDVEVLRQPDRDHGPAGGDVRADAVDPRRASSTSWYELLLGTRRRRRSWARAMPSAPSRARSSSDSTGRRKPSAAEADFDRKFIDRGMPEEIEEVVLAADGGTLHLPQVIVELFGGSRSEARRKLAQGGVKVDGEPLPAEPLDVAGRASLDGRVVQLGKRQFRPRIKIYSQIALRAGRTLLLFRAAVVPEAPRPDGGRPRAAGALDSTARSAARAPGSARSPEESPPDEAQRSLKTQQHAHPMASLPSECVQVSIMPAHATRVRMA